MGGLASALDRRGAPAVCPAISLDQLLPRLADHRRAGRTIVFTNGCFDLLHAGHLRLLNEAATLGGALVVALNSDESVRRLKGPTRPMVRAEERARLVIEVGCVDHVLLFDELTPHRLLRAILPDVLVKGGDYTIEEVVGRDIVESYGGRVCVTGHVDGVSTTLLLGTAKAVEGVGHRKMGIAENTNV